jgi:hypothetical protein
MILYSTVLYCIVLHRSSLRSFSNQWVDWSANWNGAFGSKWRRLCRGSDVEGSQPEQPVVQVDGSSSAPLSGSLNVVVSAGSGACSAKSTARELSVHALVAPLGGMRSVSGRSASPAPALGADRVGIG